MKKAHKAPKSFQGTAFQKRMSNFFFDPLILKSFFSRFRERIEYSLISLTQKPSTCFCYCLLLLKRKQPFVGQC